MPFQSIIDVLNRVDANFVPDLNQDHIHDTVEGVWLTYPCQITRRVKRSPMRGDHPLYTILSISLEGQVVLTWGCESGEDERALDLWFNQRKEHLFNHKHDRRSYLEKLFKHGPKIANQ